MSRCAPPSCLVGIVHLFSDANAPIEPAVAFIFGLKGGACQLLASVVLKKGVALQWKRRIWNRNWRPQAHYLTRKRYAAYPSRGRRESPPGVFWCGVLSSCKE